MIPKTPLFALALLFSASSSQAQIPHFQQYFLLKKNEPVQVNIIFQDRTGFLWFGTNRGLFQFDGKNYQQYTRADSLPDDNVTAIAEDSLGRIWTGHGNGKLANIRRGVVQPFDPPEGSATEPVSDILFDKNGRLWFSTLNDGLYYYDADRLYRLDDLEGMPDLFVYDLSTGTDGSIWCGTDGGIAICHMEKNKVTVTVLDHEDGLVDNIVRKISHTHEGEVLIGTEDAGIQAYDPASKSFRPLIDGNWSFGSVTDFVVQGNKVWVATSESGLVLYYPERHQIREYSKEPEYVLPPITRLLTDREGNLWAGTRNGVIRSSGAGLEFIGSLAPASGADILALTVDHRDDLWFSTSEGLFKRTLDARGQVKVTKQLLNSPYGRHTVISLYTDEAGWVWAGLYGEGVLRIDPKSGQIRYFNKELRNGNVLAITGKGNVIWLATLGGAERITITGDRFEFTNFSRQNGLSSDFIYQVFIDSRNRVWFGTDGSGIDILDNGKLNHYEDGLPSPVVYSFTEDTLQQVWVNVQGNGVFRFNEGKLLPLRGDAALRSSDVNSVVSDGYGNVLAVHDLGIDVVSSTEHHMRYYGEESGIRDKQPTLNAVAKDTYGNIYIGTDAGIIRYAIEPAEYQQHPEVIIDQFKVFDQAVETMEKPRLDYDENSVTIDFHGFWFQNAGGLQYLYKMENFDDEWISTMNEAVTYSRLPPGDYVFRIKSSENDDFSQVKEASLNFSIAPPFWSTTPFYFIVAALTIVLGYSFIKVRERQLKTDNLILERKVEERTLEIQRKTEEIQAQNEEIMAQAEEIKGINENLEMLVKERTEELQKKNNALEEYAFINAHKLRGPLASILGLINLIEKTNLDAEARVINRHLQQSADELDDIVRSITKAIERSEQ